jgi:hypothetical protein
VGRLPWRARSAQAAAVTTESRRGALPIACWLAAAGGVALVVDAVRRGGLFRYQLVGIAVSAALVVPALVLLVSPQRGRTLLRRVAFAVVPLLVLLLVAEVVLRATGAGASNVVRVVADERLGHKLEPGRGDADANGFRNERALDAADVVVLGDSVSYGFGVAREQTFAARAAAATGLTVYSMSLGGYGPVQYRELAGDALALRPRAVVIGLFLGNDLVDAAAFLCLPCAADLREPGRDHPPHRVVELDPPRAPNLAVGLLEALIDTSRVASLAARGLRDALRDRGGAWDAEAAGLPFPGDVDTLLAPTLQEPLLDLAQPRVVEGLAIAQRCIEHIAAGCRAAGVTPVLLVLPTKERCYQLLATERGAPLPQLAVLHAAEGEITQRLSAAARAAGCTVVDPTDSLLAALRAGRRCWPRGTDPHPNANGHAEIAAVLANALRALPPR